ncbi:MAG: alpha-2-macroglobulin family protein [Anaerolineales bacterium]
MSDHTHFSGWKYLAIGLVLIAAMGCRLTQVIDIDFSDDQTIPLVTDTSGEEEVRAQNGDGEDEMPGLIINLSDGSAQPAPSEGPSEVIGEPLSEDQIQAILSRLPDLPDVEGLQVDFKLPDEVLPPPRTGQTIDVVFPSPDEIGGPEPVEGQPLKVLRYSPEGEVPIAPFISVTFNQPMVPLDTLEGLADEEVPVEVSPDVSGTWRWLGTKTLNFQSDSEEYDRLPMATKYQVTIPEGVASMSGQVLEETVQFAFQTPPPTLQTYYPSNGPHALEPLMFASFDQRINPEAVLETIHVSAGGEEVPVRLATEEEVKEDERVKRMAEDAMEGRWLAFRAEEPFPANTTITVDIGPGTPSAEGPLTTESGQGFSFYTYPPLQIEDHGCFWGGEECRPLTPLYIRFNNPLDIDAYEEGMLRIQPELPNASVDVYGNTIKISGTTKARTTYRVTVDGEIKDIYGQTLGKDETLRFRIGSAEPLLFGPEQTLVTLDPASKKPVLSLYAINYDRLDVKIYDVEPSHWPDFRKYLQDYQRREDPMDPPGELVFDSSVPVEGDADTLTEVPIDLSEVMSGEFGHFIVIAEPPKELFKKERYWEVVQVWVQVTQIGLDAFVDHSEMVAWTTALKDGTSLPDVSIRDGSQDVLDVTDQKGVANFGIPAGGISYLIASKGGDSALLPSSYSYWGEGGWQKRSVLDELRWYVFDDRQMYKPGEEVFVKGWMRRIGRTETGDVELVGQGITGVRYQVTGPQGNEIIQGQAEVNAWGGFDLSFRLPENINLGAAQLVLSPLGSAGGMQAGQHVHMFQIQEFRRPEFEVKARNETTGPYFIGDQAVVAVEAKYYAGGPLPNADVEWRVNTQPTNYQPPNWPDFTFGMWTPWWMFWQGPGYEDGGGHYTFSGRTDASGNHFLKVDFESVETPRPYSLLAEATVIDVNRQAWASTTDLMVHPADLYVGMRTERYFVQQGDPMEVDLIVTDLDGEPVTDRPIQVEAARLEWKVQDGRWQEEEVDVQECSEGSENEPVTCTFETPAGGRYQITAKVTDSQGRENQSRIIRWVSGGQRPPSRKVEKEEVTLVPDKETYQPGDVAEILVQAPFESGEGLLTLGRDGIVDTKPFSFTEGSTTLNVPIKEAYLPNLHLQVDVVGSAPRTDDQGEALGDVPPRPAYASGHINLEIPPLDRTLSVKAALEDQALEPGGATNLNLEVKDARGEPVQNAELAVVVVDEAILALTNYRLTDPLSVFYQTRPAGFSSYYSRASIVLVDPRSLLEDVQQDEAWNAAQPTMVAEGALEMEVAEEEAPLAKSADTAGRGAAEAPGEEPIQVRTDFNPLATFAPEVRTDARGEASVRIQVPDNLTRYRVMVVAVDQGGKQFGSAETNLTARLPLMVRPSAPRFLNFGDVFELPVVLQNQTGEPFEADVVLRANNLNLDEEQGMRVTVPAKDRIEVRFPASTEMAGTVHFQVAAVAGDYEDAAFGELPVYTPATTEAFATYGTINEGTVMQPVAAPEDVFPQFGGLEVNTSSTALQALTDAVLYLVSYPYDCSEQIASRVLGIAALRDVLTAFEAEGLPSPQALENAVARDVEELERLQNNDGGFPYWRKGLDSIPFHTIHVAHALQRAEMKGFEVPDEMQNRLLTYLREIERHYPSWYGEDTRNTLSAYALYVRDLMGDSDPVKARNLLNDAGIEELRLDAVGWIWQVLIDSPGSALELETIRRHVGNRVVETAGAANFTTRFDDQNYLLLGSNRRTDAILLDALIADDPGSDLIPKVVNGLLAHREKGRWRNTQENVFVLLALDRYFNTFEKQTPEFVARIWLGETYAGAHTYVGRTTERKETQIPMSFLVGEGEGETQDLIIEKEGPGRLYYRLGLIYAPTDLDLDPLEMGFVVQREYEAVDDPEDVWRDEDGTWHIKAGARVRVRLTMVADNRRYHVALVDPLPAGLEIVNPALAVSGSIPEDPNSEEYRFGWWWWWTWYNHQNMRDERAEAFTPLLWDGVYEYTYVARATTPGTFVVPPAKAEEMYSPEVFGRSSSDRVIVE